MNYFVYVLWAVYVSHVQEQQLRPYLRKSTGTRQISEVKPVRGWLVLSWETTRESWVLQLFIYFLGMNIKVNNIMILIVIKYLPEWCYQKLVYQKVGLFIDDEVFNSIVTKIFDWTISMKYPIRWQYFFYSIVIKCSMKIILINSNELIFIKCSMN